MRIVYWSRAQSGLFRGNDRLGGQAQQQTEK